MSQIRSTRRSFRLDRPWRFSFGFRLFQRLSCKTIKKKKQNDVEIIRFFRYGLGFIGNILSLIIFSSLEEFRRISTGSFFLLTTISNSFHLWTLTTEFLGVFNVFIYSNSFLQCQLNFFVQNVSRATSTYLALGIAIDRFIRSEVPIQSRSICTRRNALIYSGSMFVGFSLLWAIWFSPTIQQDSTTGRCRIFSTYVSFLLTQVQVPVRMVIVCILPVILMILANVRMLYNMRKSRRRVLNQADLNTIYTINTSLGMNSTTNRRMSALDRMLFYMMLANVGTFIITQIPFHIYTMARTYSPTLDSLTHSLVRAILLIWSSIYFGVAFYVYCLAAPLFREKFVLLSQRFFQMIKPRIIR